MTKIHYGKKQFVFELTELNPETPDTENSKLKKKIEVRFNDITMIEVLKDKS